MKTYIAFAFALFALVPTQAAPEGTPEIPPQDPIIELPKYTITDTREFPPPESWNYGVTPDFEVLSNAPERETKKLLRDLTLFRNAIGVAFPVENKSPAKITLILCGKKNKFDDFKTADAARDSSNQISLLLANRELTAVILDMEKKTIHLSNADAQSSSEGMDTLEIDQYRQFYRLYIRLLFAQAKPQPPVWFMEGLSQIAMKMDFTRKEITFGKLDSSIAAASSSSSGTTDAATSEDAPEAPSPAAALQDADFHLALQKRGLIAWDEFFKINHESSETQTVTGANIWGKQSYAFVHMCMYGRGGRYKKGFLKLVERASNEPVTEAIMQECLGVTYKKLLLELRGYITMPDYNFQYYKSKTKEGFPEPEPLVLKDATEDEIGRVKGDIMLLAGNTDAARLTMLAAYQRGAKDPDFLASFGLLELAGKREDKARKLLEAAVAGKTTRARAYLTLASMRLVDVVKAAEATGGKLNQKQTASILEIAFGARALPPSMPGTYDIIAETWLRSSVKPKRENLTVLNEGILKFPANIGLIYKTALLKLQSGFAQDALPLIEMGLQTTQDPALKERFQKLRQKADEVAKQPPAATP